MLTSQQQQIRPYNSIQKSYVLNVILKLKAVEGLEEEEEICKTNGNNRSHITPWISHDGVSFLMCQSCLWSASSLRKSFTTIYRYDDDNNTSSNISVNKCPSCKNGNLESLPIASNESYKFDYDSKSGVILEFL